MPIWAPAALADLKESWDYVAADNEAAADRILSIITEAGHRLDRFPRMGRPGKIAGTREFSVPRTPYFLVYCVKTNGIEISRVMHSSRKWPPQG